MPARIMQYTQIDSSERGEHNEACRIRNSEGIEEQFTMGEPRRSHVLWKF